MRTVSQAALMTSSLKKAKTSYCLIRSLISPSSGKRLKDFLEKTRVSFTLTSNTPPEEGINSTSALNSSSKSAPRLEARGW